MIQRPPTLALRITATLAALLVGATAQSSDRTVDTVSPGDPSRSLEIEARCPTFSWLALDRAPTTWELVVYRLDGTDGEPRLALESALPGRATSWTPDLRHCLAYGGDYAWSLRAVTESRAGEWSAPSLFRVAGRSDSDSTPAGPGGGALERVAHGGDADRADLETSVGSAKADSPELTTRGAGSAQLSVSGGIEATTLDTTGAITTGGSLSLDGATDTITAGSGTLSLADENLTTTGATTTGALTVTGLDCSANANGGTLTANASGVVACADDDVGAIAPDSLDFDDLADAMTADATTTIDLDTNAADLVIDGTTLAIDSSANRVGIGTTTPSSTLEVDGDITATGTIQADGGIELGMSVLSQSPADPVSVGGVAFGTVPASIRIVGRYAYVVDSVAGDLTIFDVTDPAAPTAVGTLALLGPESVDVAGRYAYVAEANADALTVVDVSDPSAPVSVGTVGLGTFPVDVRVSGRYAYVIDQDTDDLRVVDVSDSTSPAEVGSVGVGTNPGSLFVDPPYAYVIDFGADDLRIFDVSDPTTPAQVGAPFGLGPGPSSVFVSGRYAYVTDTASQDLKILDVADPTTPALVGSVVLGAGLQEVVVTGRYAYFVDNSTTDLRVVDVADPTSPVLVASTGLGLIATTAAVSGRYAYVLGFAGLGLEVFDLAGAELSSVVAHSLEAGGLQVRENAVVQGDLRVADGATIGSGGLFSGGDVGLDGSLTAEDVEVAGTLHTGGLLTAEGGIDLVASELTTTGAVTSGDLTATGTVTVTGGFGAGSLSQPAGDPVVAGMLGIGGSPRGVVGSGRYVYVVDSGSADLKVIDVSDPTGPTLAGSLGIGATPRSVAMAGRYVYVVDTASDDLKVIDVSDPGSPSLAGSLGIMNPRSVAVSGAYAYVGNSDAGGLLNVIDISNPAQPSIVDTHNIGASESVFVSGRYAFLVTPTVSGGDLIIVDVSDPASVTTAGTVALTGAALPDEVVVSGRLAYVIDQDAAKLFVVDVSDPSSPSEIGSLSGLGIPVSVFASGRYVYVVDNASGELKVVDVSNPSAPSEVASLAVGGLLDSVFVAGLYAYVTDVGSDELKVIDLRGAEFSSAIAHSLEAGSLQVRENATVQGQLSISSGAAIGPGGLYSDGNVGITGSLALANDVAPTSSPSDLVQLYAEDVAASSELKVRDEAGNVTTLSPHNFSLLGEPSEPLAWSFYSENDAGRINVDMLRTVRLVEQVTGEKLVHAQAADGSDIRSAPELEASLREQVEALRSENQALRRESAELSRQLAEVRRILGLD